MEKAKVYFTSEITPESVVKIYERLGVELQGNVAVKLHCLFYHILKDILWVDMEEH